MDTAPVAVPSLRLRDGIEIPRLGFGVFRAPPEETQGAVELALAAGYRHIDAAAAYRNERGVGAALAASGLSREDYFVTTGLWSSQQGHDSTLMAFEASLDRLGLDHVDLYLIHRPVAATDRLVETWQTFEQIHREEAARTIGVSNFRLEDLRLLEQETETRPTINQLELHPRSPQADLRAWHAEHEIATAIWSPLAPGNRLSDGAIARLAEIHGKTPAQVTLRWHLQLGNIVIPQAVTPEPVSENVDLFDFELSEGELAAIGEPDGDGRSDPQPAMFIAL